MPSTDVPQGRGSLQDLYVVMLQTIEVLQPFAADYPEIDKLVADARTICNQLKIRLDAPKTGAEPTEAT